MKFIWEEKSIRKFLGAVIENTKTAASNRFSMLGYEYIIDAEHPQRIMLVSLDDGLKSASHPDAEMVAYLNDKGYAPVMDARRFRVE